ncbi:hypothetical protein V6X62_08225 [Spiribacter sp. 218]|uniref:COG3904 family protein n=1 Tax=Spiribacter pallidus TaxID=1987936 RepID=UPI00349FB64F
MTDTSGEQRREANPDGCDGGGDDAAPDPLQPGIGEWPKRSTGPADYIVNHWRGDLSLAKSYWLNTFLLSLPFIFMLNSLESLAHTVRSVEQTALFFWIFAALIALTFPLTAWQLIGTWRSATKRKINTGKGGWSLVAKVLMVFGWLQLSAGIVQIANDWPAYREIASYTLGLNPMGNYTVTVIDGGSGVAVRGVIARGVVDDVRSALGRAEEPFYVQLESEGGRIGVGDSLNRLIRDRSLATLVRSKCYSACTLAFLGGQSRILGEGGVIGFHQARSGLDDSPTVRTMEMSADALQRTIMREAGVGDWFIDQAMDTPSERMWTPRVEVLAEGGVITHKLSNGELQLVQ